MKNGARSFLVLVQSCALKMRGVQSSVESEYTNSVKAWSAKTGKDVGEHQEFIFYFLVVVIGHVTKFH